MDKTRVATVTAAISVMAAILALDWSNVLRVLGELPNIIGGLTRSMPFGVKSVLLSVAIGSAAWSAIFLHPSICKYRPHTCADLTAVGVGLAVNVVQQLLTDPTPRQIAWSILLGLFAGMVAMLSSRVVWSLFATPKDQPKPES